MCGGLNGELKSPLVLVPGVYDTVHGRMTLEEVNEPLVGVICVLWYSLHAPCCSQCLARHGPGGQRHTEERAVWPLMKARVTQTHKPRSGSHRQRLEETMTGLSLEFLGNTALPLHLRLPAPTEVTKSVAI